MPLVLISVAQACHTGPQESYKTPFLCTIHSRGIIKSNDFLISVADVPVVVLFYQIVLSPIIFFFFCTVKLWDFRCFHYDRRHFLMFEKICVVSCKFHVMLPSGDWGIPQFQFWWESWHGHHSSKEYELCYV